MMWWRKVIVKTRPQPDWHKWLTASEAVELLVLCSWLKSPKHRHKAKREIELLRQMASHRRKRNSRRFAIYIQAMGD